MDSKIERFFEEMREKKVAFCGIGVSNIPLALLFAQKGAIVSACDKRVRSELGDVCSQLEQAGVSLKLGSDYLQNLEVDVIFKTPGMRHDLPEFEDAKKRGTVITSEMEVFFELCPCKLIAVTGSDGKTTTTTLISEMLKAQGFTVHLGGNIGRPLLPIIESVQRDDIAVVELSSFQLMTMHKSPDIAVVTNVAPNHLDVHKSLVEYVDAKKNILLHQNCLSKSVLNLDNHVTRNMAEIVNGQLAMFSRLQKVENGAYVEGDSLYLNDHGTLTKVMIRKDIRIPGEHNVENYLAAICAVWGLVEVTNIVKVAQTFTGVEHRMELVRELNGVKWYNDSIATNPTRTIAGLHAYPQKIILIAGGYDKHIPFEPMVPAIIEKVKFMILMGVTAGAIRDAVTLSPNYNPLELPIAFVNTMEEAVALANKFAQDGDIVSLSPASASFDKYKNFELRGNHFKRIVNLL